MASLSGGGRLPPMGVRAVVEGYNEYLRRQRRMRTETQKTAKALDKTGKETKKAGKAQDSARKSTKRFTDVIRGLGQGLGVANLAIAGITVALAALSVKTLRSVIRTSIEFESAVAGVRKTVDATEAVIQTLGMRFRALALQIPLNAAGLARIGELAGQLGVRVGDIASFTAVIAKLGLTTNLVGEEGAVVLARFMNIMGTAAGRIGELGNVIVDLGNNMATTEAEIARFGLRIAGAGKQVGLTEGEILGIAAALSSLGVNAEAGGTAISRTMIEIDKAVAEAGDELTKFADVSGLSAKEFAELWGRDAAQALSLFIVGLGQTADEGANLFQVLEDLGLNEIRVRDALLRTANASDLFNDALRIQAEAVEQNTALNIEFAKRMATTEAQVKLAKNAMDDMAISIGEDLILALKNSLQGFIVWRREVALTRATAFEFATASIEGRDALAKFGIELADSKTDLETQRDSLDEMRASMGFLSNATLSYVSDLVGLNRGYTGLNTEQGRALALVQEYRDAVFKLRGEEISRGQAVDELNILMAEQARALDMQIVAQRLLDEEIARGSIAIDNFAAGMLDLAPILQRVIPRGAKAFEERLKRVKLEVMALQNPTGLPGVGVAANATGQSMMAAVPAVTLFAEALERVVAAAKEARKIVPGRAPGTAITPDVARIGGIRSGAEAPKFFLGVPGPETGGGGDRLTPEEIQRAQGQFSRWLPLFRQLQSAQSGLNRALQSEFGLRQKVIGLQRELLNIQREITEATRPHTDELEEIDDRVRTLDFSLTEFQLTLAKLREQRGVEARRALARGEDPVESLEGALERAKGEEKERLALELETVKALEKQIRDAESILAIKQQDQAGERERLEVEQRRAELQIDGIRDAHEERIAAISDELRLTEISLNNEIELRRKIVEAAKASFDEINARLELEKLAHDEEEESLSNLQRRIILEDQINGIIAQRLRALADSDARHIASGTSGLGPRPMPQFADGGRFGAGQSMIVGERGPEVMTATSGGNVGSNASLNRLSAAIGSLAIPAPARAPTMIPVPIERNNIEVNASYRNEQSPNDIRFDLETMFAIVGM